ncbi:T9SS type A sorting domain-containing protein [uncultured Winogradskyella sp.]|uniref:T9SS type A sorting domain-containing protein n=1 Tax=uncultured Winogradskyella sp. TaxID=395353 RepID=UPI00260E052F|nr:T9SS type A sorting domain-containing protein [uncultured Winogradskyella sp.]
MKSPKLPTNFLCYLYPFLSFFILISFNSEAQVDQLPAFPSAYGAGAYATGGRGQEVYHVTNLNDSGPGSFRDAVSQSNRMIVFDVSGIINIQSNLYINQSNLTIAGQTAPEGGITITGSGNVQFQIKIAENIIMRYIRVRMQFYGNTAFTVYPSSAIQERYSRNHIFDHMSISYAGLQGFTVRGLNTHNITFQNGLIAECKTGALFGDTDPGQTGYTYNNTFRNNFFYNISHRTPNTASQGTDIYNNVVYNWLYRLSTVVNGARVNHFDNYYFLGNRTSLTAGSPPRWEVNGGTNNNPSVPFLIWSKRNVVQDLFTDTTADNQYLWMEHAYSGQTERLDPSFFTETQFPIVGRPAPAMTAVEASTIVPQDAGAYKFLNADGSFSIYRDPQDTRYVTNTVNDTPEPYNNSGGTNNRHTAIDEQPYANFLASITGEPINIRPANFYNASKNEHIPEIWFDENVPPGQDHNDISPSGYTWLEEYLNGVDEAAAPIVIDSLAVTPDIVSELRVSDSISLTATMYAYPEDTDGVQVNNIGQWISSDESIATVDENGVVTAISTNTESPFQATVTITFTITDSNGDTFEATSQITVFPEALQASAGDNQQICEGESTTLTASGGTNYVWSTGETTASIEVTPDITTTYTVTVTDDFEQSEESSVIVEVNPLPEANAGEDQTICEGESITLVASGGDSYLWNTGETTESIVVSPDVETAYSVEVISNSCSNTDDVTIFVNNAPEITITEDIVIVEGDSTILTATGGDNYEWSTGETTESITVSPMVTTTYSVSSLGLNGCSGYAEVVVTVIPEIIADAGEDVTICSGDTVTLIASGGVTYIWDTGDTGSELIVNPTVTTTYTVTAEDDYGYTDTDTVTIIVNEIPDITVDEEVFVMIGNSTTLTISGGDSYSWSTGETTDSITVSPDITTTYTVTAFFQNGCQSTFDVLVTVVEVLNANAGDDVSICLGESISLNASGGITYDWNTGAVGASPIVSPTETTTYTVTVTDGYGNSDSDDVTVTVNPVPTATASEDQVICNGETATLTAEGGDSYLWSTGETTSTITVNPNTDAIYTVEVFSNNCSDTDEVIVTVLPSPEISISDDIVLITGNSVTLDVSGGDSYVWDTGETINTIEVSPTETTTYSVTAFLNNGCQSTAQVTVTVIPQVIADAGNDISICSGDSVTLNASGGGTYAWNTGDTGASPTFSPNVTTTYTVTVSDEYGNSDSDSVIVTVNDIPDLTVSDNIIIYEGDTTTLIANGADSYLWNTGETTSSIIVSPTETTTFSVSGSSVNGCQSEAEVTVTVIPQVIADAGNDVTICSGESVTLNASGGGTYAWNTGDTSATPTFTPTATTTYTVIVTDSYGNSDSDSVTITVNELPNVTVSDNIVINEGESTTLIANGAESYLWNTGETTSSIIVNPNLSTTYTVTGFITNGCQSDAEVIVTVIPDFEADAGDDVAICSGESITLEASGGVTYTWNTGDTGATPTFTPTATTTYTVTVTDGYGNSDSDSVTITVNELPNVTVSDNVTILEGESITLVAAGAENYQWNTGQTTSAITVSPTQTTTYIVMGIRESCTGDAQVTVFVQDVFEASAGEDESVCDNEIYEVVLTANQGDSYLWSTGETSQSIVVSPSSTSTYSVTVTLGDQQDTDDVTVYVDPSPEVVIANGDSVEILNGDFITLSASGADTYEWNNGATQPNIAVSPSVTTTYEVKGYIGNCYDEKQVTVNVLEPVVANAGDDVTICMDETAVLTATGGDDYVWNTGETTQTIEVSPSITTNYTVTVFNALDFDEASVTVDVDASCVEEGIPIDSDSDFSFDIFPNPANDVLNVKLSGGALIISAVHIYDFTGKLIKTTKIENIDESPSATRQIDISSLQNGVYFVKLIDIKREVTKKLIVN